MRIGLGGLALAVVVSVAACSKSEPPAPAAPAGLSLSVIRQDVHGVLPAQTTKITVKGKKGDYSADVAVTPNWWVGQGEFKVFWYEGLSQTKRFFTFSNITGDPSDQPDFLKNPETGVRQVEVRFDGAPPLTLKPDTTRAAFKIPAGAKAVTQVNIDFGSADAPQSLTWK